MKTLLTLIFLASTFSIVGCHKRAEKNLDELLLIVRGLGQSQESFFRSVDGIGDSDTMDFFVPDYHPVSGKNRLVLRIIDGSDGEDLRYYGLDMTGYHAVLKDLEGKSDNEKLGMLQDFIRNATIDFLDVVGAGEDTLYFEKVSGKLFSVATPSNKDLESFGAKMEMRNVEEFSEILAADYGLSEDRAQKVARTINAYKKITSKRSLTEREHNAYSRELLGVDYKKAEKAIMQGDNFDQLMEDAAEKNGTSPEQVSAIIRDMIL